MKLINGNKLANKMDMIAKNHVPYDSDYEAGVADTWEDAAECVREYQTIEAEPVVHAHWNLSYEEVGAFETTRTYYFGHCSKCGRKIDIVCLSGLHSAEGLEEAKRKAHEDYPYCHCGAKMDEKGE